MLCLVPVARPYDRARKFAKRTTPGAPRLADDERLDVARESGVAERWAGAKGDGYTSMRQACREISELVDVVWVSGTPSLQVPYLIHLALVLADVVPAMPLSPRSLFRCMEKIDRCFASLIQGRYIESGEALPGFEGRRGVSGTEKVPIRSLVERSRVGVVEAFKRGEFDEETPVDDRVSDEDMEGGLVLEGEGSDADEDSWDMQLARVYDRTIQELGDTLEEPGIGIVTERRV
ncbi:hypothetical protein B0A55_08826 [Friedmanniomyces simplex]|uniref:Uncharacterized protein n=1 Tax=Friedmanniomyces simplex TaxID=329884 RepID=A0A4U0X0Z7_9PEZI|nr:hypothetical protein B0A55_08826 [Friedmanniomyces simplex]